MTEESPETAGCPFNVAEFWRNPGWFLRRLDPVRGRAHFIRLAQEQYARFPFLDTRHLPDKDELLVPLQALQASRVEQGVQHVPVNYILHHAFCGSTLLARLFEHASHAVVLKEPGAIHELSFRLRGATSDETPPAVRRTLEQCFDLALLLHERSEDPASRIIMKPSDSCCSLIDRFAAAHPDSRFILMHTSLEEFVVSACRSQNRRTYVREMVRRALHDAPQLRSHVSDSPSLTDAEACALIWVSVMRQFQRAVEVLGPRVRLLEGRAFTADPLVALEPAMTFFGVTGVALTRSRIHDSGILLRDSKDQSRTVDAQQRNAERASRRAELDAEVEQSRAWLQRLPKDLQPNAANCAADLI